MALNLSTLTSPATSGDVLAEALTTADFLEPVPVLRNLSRGSNKGGDAKQGTALNQPKALPLDANGKGYCYLPVTTGNAPAVTFPAIGGSDDFVLEMDVYLVSGTNLHFVSGANGDHRLAIYNGAFYIGGFSASLSSPLALGVSNIKIERTSGTITLKQNDAVIASRASSSALTFTHLSFNGQFGTSILPLNGYIQKATLSIGGTEQLNCDFTATNVRHGDTKLKCATGQVVTINQAGNDPATVIKKPVLRFDGTNDGLRGVFANNINSGYMFAAFSVLGDGGEAYGRVFSTNLSTSGNDFSGAGTSFSIRYSDTLNLSSLADATINQEVGLFDDANGDILHVVKIKSGEQTSSVNNAALLTNNRTTSTNSDEFNIGFENNTGSSACIDLQFLGFFPETLTTDQAADVVNYINNRNNVFDLKDGFGYYFFDAQKAPVGAISSGSSSWNGRIVGSDNGDTDRYLTQGTSDDQAVGDGYVVTFADNTDHLEIPQVTQAGWQIVGTSIGTFAYRVNNNAVSELNLLGNLGNASYRQSGQSYGMILLPDSATGGDIEAARKLLIDRGASEGFTGSNLYAVWYQRGDIVEFKAVPMPHVTNIGYSFAYKTALVSFPAMSFPALTYAGHSWEGNTSMNNFGAIQAPLCATFSNTWKSCSALTSFPAGAKLGTEANNVNFDSAWQSSGLTSFPALDLSKGAIFNNAWNSCTSLSSFPAINLSQGTHFSFTWYNTALTAFPYISFEKARTFYAAWYINNSLVDFASGCFDDWNPDSIENNCFGFAFVINNLSSQSVENILVSIDSSGQHATTDGTSNTNPITGTNIDLKYNTATGSLSAATNAAVTSLKTKGWSIIVNNVTL